MRQPLQNESAPPPTAPTQKPSLLDMAQAVRFERLIIRLAARQSGSVPGFLGATLHGALGAALYRAPCMDGPAGQPCSHDPPCGFATWLGGAGEGGADDRGRRPSASALRFPREQNRWESGDLLEFELVHFRPEPPAIFSLATALETMGAEGLGPNRVRFSLSGIWAWNPGGLERPLWKAGASLSQPRNALVADDLPTLGSGRHLEVRFKTPTRLLVGGELPPSISFDLLFKGAARRIGAIAHAQGSELAPLIAPWLDRAATVKLARCLTTITPIWRWSSRQRQEHPLHGLVGTATYEGDGLAAFEPLLRLATQLGVGKNTSFGLGQVEMIIRET